MVIRGGQIVMPEQEQSQRRCVACGRLIDAEVLICPYCEDRSELRLQLARTQETPELQIDAEAGETYETVQLNAQVSVAVNTRRIALTLILALAVLGGTSLVVMMTPLFITSPLDARNLLKGWSIVAVIAMVAGLSVIMFEKRFTRLS
jgi:hypothetical protein